MSARISGIKNDEIDAAQYLTDHVKQSYVWSELAACVVVAQSFTNAT